MRHQMREPTTLTDDAGLTMNVMVMMKKMKKKKKNAEASPLCLGKSDSKHVPLIDCHDRDK